MTDSRQNSGKGILYGIIALLLLSNIFLAWLYFQEKENFNIAIEEKGILDEQKMELEAELKDMYEQYEEMKTSNDTLNRQLLEQQEKIQELLTKAKNNNWTIHKLRKETETLREIMKGYLRTIDSLNTANIQLKAEKQMVTLKLDKEKEKNTQLNEQNTELSEKVKIGERLKAQDLFAAALKERSNNTHRETDRAKRTDMLKACLTLMRNDLTPLGKKWVYARIIAPSGKVICLEESEDNMFEFEGVKGLYSVKKEVDYKGEDTDVCLYWYYEEEALVEVGSYEVYMYVDNYELGKTSFELK